MKHSAKVKQQRAYITRRNDADGALFAQQDAAILAFQNGDMAEMKRREAAATALKAKRRRAEIKPIAFHIIRELGPRDSIANMLKDRFLEERHGRTALRIRDYMVAREVTMAGGGNLVFVEGGTASGIESKIGALRLAAQAIAAGEATLPSAEFVKPVTGLLCGFITIRQASGQLRGRTKDVEQRIKSALRAYLEAAEPFFGGGS